MKKDLFKLRKSVQFSSITMPRTYLQPTYLRETFESYQRRRREATRPQQPRAEPRPITRQLFPNQPPLPRITPNPLIQYYPNINNSNERIGNFLNQLRIVPLERYNAFSIGELPNDPITQYNRFNSCTECFNIDANYALELLKTISVMCPPLIYIIPKDKILKLRWEHQQYDRAVDEIFNSNIKRMLEWQPNDQAQRRALHYMIYEVTKEINNLIRLDFSLLNCFDRDYYGALNELRFIDVISAASEVLECVKEANLIQNNYPIPLGHIGEWIKGNKSLQSMFFKVVAFLFSVGDYRVGFRESAVEFLKEVKKEKAKDNWVEMISDDETTEISAIEVVDANVQKAVEEELPLFISVKESEQILNDLFFNPRKEKK